MILGRSYFNILSCVVGICVSTTISAQSFLRIGSVEKLNFEGFEQSISLDTSSGYLKRLSNAVAFTQSAMVGDYSTSYEHILLNVGVGLGYQEGYASVEEVLSGRQNLEELSAFAAQGQVGLGFRFHNEQRSRFFLSFASSEYSKNSFQVETSGWGILWQYDLFEEKTLGGPLLSWQGLRLGAGFRYNHFKSDYSRAIQAKSVSLDVENEEPWKLSFSALGRLSSDVKTSTIPLEVGTAFQWLKVLSVYGVLGADYHWGKAEGVLSFKGPVELKQADEEAVKTELEYASLKNAKPDALTARALVGIQFNLSQGSVYLQYQRSSLQNAEAASLGFRAYF